MTAPALPAHTHYSEQSELHLFQCLERALHSLASLHQQLDEVTRRYPPDQPIEYLPIPISDAQNPVLCKKLGRRLLYILSPQNLTLTCTDYFSPTLTFVVQSGVLTLLPFPEGTKLTSTSGILDTSPVKVLTIASDRRLI